MKKKVQIIGAGFGGLASAAILAKEGFDVTVTEKNSKPGGRAMEFRAKGYRFDMGPSWYLMPEAFENFFTEFGRKPEDFYKLKLLSPAYRVFFDDKKIDVSEDLNKNYKTFDKLEKNGGKKLKKFLEAGGRRYSLAMNKLLYKDYSNLGELLDPILIKEILGVGLFENLENYVGRYFKSEEARRILLFNTVFVGVSPKMAPSLYSMLAYADLVKKVWYPEGGFYSVVKAMERLARENGAKFKYNAEVKKINPDSADYIISNADYWHTETKLLDKTQRSLDNNYWKNKVIAPSAFCIYLGVKKKIKNLIHHNLYLGGDWDRNFEEIFEDKKWPTNPSYYVCVPSKTDKTTAPKGKENIFILVPIASDLADTKKIREKYYKKIISHLEAITGENIEENVEYKKIITLKDYREIYNAYEGSAFGLAHTLFQTAIFRPPSRSKKVDNLYYTGQYIHPGVGVPTSIISGQLVAKRIIKDNEKV